MFEAKYKALSGYAEWFWLMAKNWKDVENRNWSLASRGIRRSQLPMRIYLHASKTPASYDELNFIETILINEPTKLDEFLTVDWSKYRGHIIGEITIVDEVTAQDIGMKVTRSRWFFGIYGFVVKDGALYDEPIPCKGKLGFFTPTLTEVSVFGLSMLPRGKE